MSDTTEPKTAWEHRAEAERLVKISTDTLSDFTRNTGEVAATAMSMMMWATAQAQVHATLAVAAAQYEAADFLARSLPTYEGDLSVRVHGQASTR